MFTKLFSSIVHSSIWLEDLETKVLWITMLALMDRHGCVYGSVGGLAHTAGIPATKAREILDKFLAPDPDSADLDREPERGGRRIEMIGGGWRILNAAHYRAIRDAEERREQNRSAKAAQRARESAATADNQRKSASEAEAEGEGEGTLSSPTVLPTTEGPARKRAERAVFVPPSPKEVSAYAIEQGWTRADWNTHTFVDFFASKGWMVGRVRMKDWRAAARNAFREGWTVRKGGNGAEPRLTPEEKADRAAASQRLLDTARAKLARGEGV